ncbi:protein kinase domain-containing protein [Streptomyces odontomachi]|uniref:protein kinase domain-containing protein n=1 Tax=Streptomyces odontomachi TaxID=2944940 RepID=UPI00210971DA|nr:protein kinase [Streptomyces sp. ODS25]
MGDNAPTGRRIRPLSGDDPVRLGAYRLLGRIASGGMGRIYLARPAADGPLVAVKTLLDEGVVSETDRRRFAREVTLARRIDSAYTARVLDADPDAERPWMAIEYIAAPALSELVGTAGRLPGSAVRWIAAGTARALVTLHDAGIVHRDVKPQNILLPQDGPRLIDFGISHASDITRTTLTLGTIAFTSPEQARAEPSGPASDVYSLGATLFHVAVGRPPYADTGDTIRLLTLVQRGELDLTGLPKELAPLIRPCLAADPTARPAPGDVLQNFLDDLDRFATSRRGDRWLPPRWTSLIQEYEAQGRALRAAGASGAPAANQPGARPVDPEALTIDQRTRQVPPPTPTRVYTDLWRSAPGDGERGDASGGADRAAADRAEEIRREQQERARAEWEREARESRERQAREARRRREQELRGQPGDSASGGAAGASSAAGTGKEGAGKEGAGKEGAGNAGTGKAGTGNAASGGAHEDAAQRMADALKAAEARRERTEQGRAPKADQKRPGAAAGGTARPSDARSAKQQGSAAQGKKSAQAPGKKSSDASGKKGSGDSGKPKGAARSGGTAAGKPSGSASRSSAATAGKSSGAKAKATTPKGAAAKGAGSQGGTAKPKPPSTGSGSGSSSSSSSESGCFWIVAVIVAIVLLIWQPWKDDSSDSGSSGSSDGYSSSTSGDLSGGSSDDTASSGGTDSLTAGDTSGSSSGLDDDDDSGTDSGSGSDADDGASETSSPPPDPVDTAFGAVSSGDCLDVYQNGYGQWSRTSPEQVSCGSADAYLRVTQTGDGATTCSSGGGRGSWEHTNTDFSSTTLCLERQFRTGQCFLAKANGDQPGGADLLTLWSCSADKVPQGFNYIMQITAIMASSAGTNACPGDGRHYTYSWNVYDGGTMICTKVA